MPFVVALGAHFLIPGERMTVLGFFGLALAFVGVIIVFSDKLSLPGPEALFGDLLCLIAAVLWGATTIVIKTTRLRTTIPEKVLLYQLVVAAAILLPVSPAFGPLIRDITPAVVAAFSFQVLFIVSVTFLVWFWLIRHYPASRLTSFTFLTPVFGVMFGGLLLGEPVGWRLIVALGLVAVGIYLVNRPQAMSVAP
jgi:drug/metabolite transporter (DMT)-like permease